MHNLFHLGEINHRPKVVSSPKHFNVHYSMPRKKPYSVKQKKEQLKKKRQHTDKQQGRTITTQTTKILKIRSA
jgi:hypothetical protein